jgi:uncharacterized membrane protein
VTYSRFPPGTPGRRLFFIGAAAPFASLLLIAILGPVYGHTRAWTVIYVTIAAVAFAVGAPCCFLAIIQNARHRRSQGQRRML